MVTRSTRLELADDDVEPAGGVHPAARRAPACGCARPLVEVDEHDEALCVRCGREVDGGLEEI